MRYAGGKGKCYHEIINLLPPHSTYIETHLGGGAVLRHKKSALHNVGVDIDPEVIQEWRKTFPRLAIYKNQDAFQFLKDYAFTGDELVYCDPPYLASTRKRPRVYRFDYSEEDHIKLLSILKKLPCKVVISGYPSSLYEDHLSDWQRHRFQSKAHDGMRTETLWFNFDRPSELHEYQHLGNDFRERQTIKRRLDRLKRRIGRLSEAERNAIWTWLASPSSRKRKEGR